ncbi:hypothetical protein WR25_19551 [Diploscapter pachys]|uniref:Large ribosomal subunit protein mL40 n=1 Tax=Diploscapter pachys TaxID=2018661 RepID=A0A2A2JEH9_9BILA|nr:hypothetical protein WR25_19551 [Diploscapter pachys]
MLCSLAASSSRLCVNSLVSTSFLRPFHTTPLAQGVFMKKQKKIDPEVAKAREHRKRKKLEREIREMLKHSKKSKPIDEMTIDVISAKNINERRRPPTVLTSEQLDERAVIFKNYTRSRAHLMIADDEWIRTAFYQQKNALNELKKLDLKLYEEAVKPSRVQLPLVIHGPTLTPPAENYDAPDGEYIDTTRTWV